MMLHNDPVKSVLFVALLLAVGFIFVKAFFGGFKDKPCDCMNGGVCICDPCECENCCEDDQEEEGHFGAFAFPNEKVFKVEEGVFRTPEQVNVDLSNRLEGIRDRMQFLQSTELGSDQNARAMFSVMEAIDHLKGSEVVSAEIPNGESDEE